MAYNFSQSQVQTAQQVLAAVPQANSTERLALMEAGLVESGMQNLTYGDRDSRGVFQERPSQGWTNVNNVAAATVQMFNAMNKSLTDPGAMAQSGERSAYPARYDAIQGEAQALLTAAGGGISLTASTNPNAPWWQNLFGIAASGSPGAEIPGGSNVLPGDTAIPSLGDWLAKVAPRVGLIVFGALFVLVGVWMAANRKAGDLPKALMNGGNVPGGQRAQRSADNRSG